MERGDIVFLVRSGCRFDFPYFCKGIKGPGYDIFDWRNSATVPGNGIYQIMNYVLQNDRSMASFYLTQTLEIAGAIALAIFLMDTLFKVVRKGEWKQDSLRYIQKEERKEEEKW